MSLERNQRFSIAAGSLFDDSEVGNISLTTSLLETYQQDAGSMISLVTLAHRVSSIHKRYAAIHSSVFSFSISQLVIDFWGSTKTDYCEHGTGLVQLTKELAETRSIIAREETLEQANTINREFAFALDVYIIALSDAITALSTICDRRCRDNKGVETYSRDQDRTDRQDYDDAIQQYRYLGKRLESLFKRL